MDVASAAVQAPPPFILLERDDGSVLLRAFSDTSEGPISLVLDQSAGRRFGVAVADVLTRLDAGEPTPSARLLVDGREVAIEGTLDGGLRISIAPPPAPGS